MKYIINNKSDLDTILAFRVVQHQMIKTDEQFYDCTIGDKHYCCVLTKNKNSKRYVIFIQPEQ